MARTPTGHEVLGQAKALAKGAASVIELKQALTVLLPLEAGLSIAKTAEILGVSSTWACQMRRRFIQRSGLEASVGARGGRRRQLLTLEQEQAFVQEQLASLKAGESLNLGRVRAALESRIGRPVALSTVYALWRRHAPIRRATNE